MSQSIISSVSKRFTSTSAFFSSPGSKPVKPPPRKGRKGHLYVGNVDPPPITPEEEVRVIKRRIQKAERDERMDVTAAMTPVKTYMGGFTRPRDLRTLMWMPGGPYQRKGKVYESPAEAAYESHTVYLLESRHPVKFGIGRADSLDHVVGCCAEGDFEAVLKRYNSERAPSDARESMDNAVWPWLDSGKKVKKRVKWWDPGEDPNAILREIHGENTDVFHAEGTQDEFVDAEEDDGSSPVGKAKGAKIEATKNGDSHAGASTDTSSNRPHAQHTPLEPSLDQRSPSTPSKSPLPPANKRSPLEVLTPPAFPEPPHRRTFSSSSPLKTDYESNSGGIVRTFYTKQDQIGHEDKVGVTTSDTQPSRSIPPELKRCLHSSAVVCATEVPLTADDRPLPPHIADTTTREQSTPFENVESSSETSSTNNQDSLVRERRNQYLPTLSSEPFWRPILSITVSTRPLAATLLRLSKALPRGLPFYASIHNDDRKYGVSFGARMRCMRIARMSGLVVEMAQLLGGARGGYLGIRFNVDSAGRGLDREALASPIPWDKRVIKVGVGNWFYRASELKEAFQLDAEEKVASIVMGTGEMDNGPFEIFGLDDWGKRTDDKTGEVIPWPKSKLPYSHESLVELNRINSLLDGDDDLGDEKDGEVMEDMNADEAYAESKKRNLAYSMKRRDAKLRRQDISRTYSREIALAMAQKHRSVVTP